MKKAVQSLLNSRQTGARSVSSLQNQIKGEPASAAQPHRYCSGGYHPVNLRDKFQNRYRVIQKLGFGVYSTVWLANDERFQPSLLITIVLTFVSTNRHVALKVMTADALLGEKHIDELRILQRTGLANPQHQGYSRIVQLLDHFEHHGPHGTHLCLVMELLGTNLSDIQSLYLRQQKAVPSIIVRRFLKQVLIGLDYLHRSCGIVHTGDRHFCQSTDI
jgi:serine/threonine-protein kinase SRPK3